MTELEFIVGVGGIILLIVAVAGIFYLLIKGLK